MAQHAKGRPSLDGSAVQKLGRQYIDDEAEDDEANEQENPDFDEEMLLKVFKQTSNFSLKSANKDDKLKMTANRLLRPRLLSCLSTEFISPLNK